MTGWGAQHGTASMAEWPRVAVVLVNWNGWRDCVECLDSLLACDYPAFDVFVVDNASGDGSVEHIADWCRNVRADPQWRAFDGVERLSARPGATVKFQVHEQPGPVAAGEDAPVVHIVRSGGNLGFAGGNNVGLRMAEGASYGYFWILNTDTVVHSRALHHLVERAQLDDCIGIVGSTLRYYGEPDLIQAMGGAHFNPANTETRHIGLGRPLTALPAERAGVETQMDYVVGASMLVSARFVREVGPMQEDYFLYFEEFDWALRGKPTFRLAYAPDSHVFHKVGASSAAVASLRSLERLYRSRLHFLRRFMAAKVPASRRNMLRHAFGYARRGRFAHARVLLRVWWESRDAVTAVVATGAR